MPDDPSRSITDSGPRQVVLNTKKWAEGFANPWADETRTIRRYLLLLGIVGITIAAARIYPTQISVLGISAGQISPSALLIVLAVIVGYLTFTYPFYAYSDLM